MSSSIHAQAAISRPSIADAAQIALRGPSAEVVTEFFHFCVNSILYQRGPLLYPPESYRRVSKYGLTMHLTTDPALISYMSTVTKQLEGKQKEANYITISHYYIIIKRRR